MTRSEWAREMTRRRWPVDRPVPHGTISGYLNRQCRCQECRAAWAKSRREYVARQRAKRIAEGLHPPLAGIIKEAPIAAA